MKARVLGAGLACLLLVLSVSGCVDIFGAKDVFSRKGAAAKTVFKDKNKVNFEHLFETKLTNPESWSYSGSTSFKVRMGSPWLVFLLELTLIPIPAQIPSNLVPERFLHVKVIMADGAVWIDARYTNSTRETITAVNPIDGPWSVSIEAVGVGLSQRGYQDSVHVMVTAREPV